MSNTDLVWCIFSAFSNKRPFCMTLLPVTLFCRGFENLLVIVGKLPCDIKLTNVNQLSIAERYLKDILSYSIFGIINFKELF